MNLDPIDWIIVGAFGLLLVAIVVVTNRLTKSVAGFLSSERCAGRYLLTVASSMAFCSAIGVVGGFEGGYRNGISGMWWGMLMMPVGTLLALSGWVTYRYRQTRSLTMAQFLEKRYSRRFRVFAGFVAFFAGMLNCAVFPLVTAHFLVYFLGLPEQFGVAGIELSTHFWVMAVMVSLGVTLALAGGQITIMVTDFFQGTIGTVALIGMMGLVLSTVGWSDLLQTLKVSEDVRVLKTEAGDLTYPQWYLAKVAPVREHHAALESAQPGVFGLMRAHPSVLDGLAGGVEAARKIAAESRGTGLERLELTPGDYAADAVLSAALTTGVDGAAVAARSAADALLADDLEENDAEAAQLRLLAESPTTLRAAAERFGATRLLVEEDYPDMVEVLDRAQGASMMNPSKLGNEGAFSVPFFIMMGLVLISQTGVWQGGSGYLTAARTPHEGKMGAVLGNWRWMTITLGSTAAVVLVYCLVWNVRFANEQAAIMEAAAAIKDPLLQSQQFVPAALGLSLPAGLMGLFAVFMIGASISTDDSAYHSWGSIFLQDVVMPFRKTPFTTKQHLFYLRLSIAGVGLFALLFSTFWRLGDFINMWFQITGAIYTGGAMCAIVGGLYWKRGTTWGAWCGLITGSSLSLYAIYFLNTQDPELPALVPRFLPMIGGEPVNGLHLAVFNILISIGVYAFVSVLTCREPFNLDRLLHRGEYVIEDDVAVAAREAANDAEKTPSLLRFIGITDEFSGFDKFIYLAAIGWTVLLSGTFLIGTTWFLFFQSEAQRNNSEGWYVPWTWLLGIQGVVSVVTGVWFACGGARDMIRLLRDVAGKSGDDADDGYVR